MALAVVNSLGHFGLRLVLPATVTAIQNVPARSLHKKTLKQRKRLKKLDEDMSWTQAILEYRKEKEQQANEEPCEPHQLHVVWRKRSLVGRPWWEKDIMKKLGLAEYGYYPTIHKNTPSINAMLQEVKHLVVIKPLSFPHGVPEHESDFDYIHIKPTGEAIVKKRLQPTEEQRKGSHEWVMNPDVIKKQCDNIRLNYNIHTEYHRPDYVYKKNQDGKEYRYNFNKDNPPYKD